MNMIESVRTCFRKYANFKDPASRSEYWWFVLFYYLVSIVLLLTGVSFLRFLWLVFMIIPGLSVAVRRMHDSGHSGWWVICPIWGIVLLCFPTLYTNNKYVPDRSSGYSVPDSAAQSTGEACPVCGKLRLPGQNYCVGCGTKFTS